MLEGKIRPVYVKIPSLFGIVGWMSVLLSSDEMLHSFTTAQGGFRSLGIDDFNFDFRRFSSFYAAGTQLFRISVKF